MRNKLTISEVSKLLNISAHTIRYYDKEEIITVKKDENDYRLFDLEDVARLANVVLLRETGIPVKKIKALVMDYSVEGYENELITSLENIKSQLRKIEAQKRVIEKTLLQLKNKDAFTFKNYDTRYLRTLKSVDYEDKVNAIDYFNLMKDFSSEDILYKDMIYDLRTKDMVLCIEDFEDHNIELAGGEYLEYSFTVENDAEINDAIERYLAFVEDNSLLMKGAFYLSLSSHAMLIVESGYQAILFSKVWRRL